MNDEEKDDQIAVVDTSAGTMQIYAHFPAKKFDLFSFTQPAASELILDGSMNGHKIHARLPLFDTSEFFLVTHSGEVNWLRSRAYR